MQVPPVTLSVGSAVPLIVLESHLGGALSPADFKGHPLVLFFMGEGSSDQLIRGLAEVYGELEALGGRMMGVGPGDMRSHRSLARRCGARFPLLSDEDGSAALSFGAGVMEIVDRKIRVTPLARTFLISSEQRIIKVYGEIDPASHPAEVLEDVRRLFRSALMAV